MHNKQVGTANVANLFAVVALATLPTTITQANTGADHQTRTNYRTIPSRSVSAIIDVCPTTIITNDSAFEESKRQTTPHEKIIGEMRRWLLLGANWDGEGSQAPSHQSIKEASAFVRLIDDTLPLPEPMVLASGHAALYWNTGDIYADLEFLGNQRIAYFIKKHEDKHKGVLTFDSNNMPAVFSALLEA